MAEVIEKGVQKYLDMISAYDAEFKKWESRNTKIVKKYRDEGRNARGDTTAKFNILWSNVQTLIPAVYAKLPKADVKRRYGDNDQIGRVSSMIIERALDFEIEHYPDFRATMRNCVEDRFLGGRGQAWVRYEPHVRAAGQSLPEDGLQVTEDTDDAPTDEEIDYECAPVDYVHWKDFGHNVARTWDEVTCVWRWVYMSKPALVERFGAAKAEKLDTSDGPEGLNGRMPNKDQNYRAKVCELWDKETGKAYWLMKDTPQFIDVVDDPLGLEGFFPCPRPLYATMTSDTLVPVPDFTLYQDQANELDILSDRIDGLVKALKVRGVYNSSIPALQRLMSEGDNNTLIPVDQWLAFGEKGGLKGAIDLVPLDMIALALTQCYLARDNIKAQIYEITGISDIIRGQTAAQETATAQQIKGQYAGLRLRSMQDDVALFATELLRLKAQIICGKFQPETILQYSAADQLSADDKAMVPQALQLLQSDPLRSFRVEVAADSLVQIDEQKNKEERIEFLTAFGGFMEKALPVGQAAPDMVPIIAELMKFGVGAFKSAAQVEGAIDSALNKVKEAQKQKAANPQPQRPDPETIKAQAAAQLKMQELQATGQFEAARLQAQQQADSSKVQLEMARLEAEKQKALIDADLQIKEIASREAAEQLRASVELEKAAATLKMKEMEIAANADLAIRQATMKMDHEKGMVHEQREFDKNEAADDIGETAGKPRGVDPEAFVGILSAIPAQMEEIAKRLDAVSRPRKIVRGPDNLIQGIE